MEKNKIKIVKLFSRKKKFSLIIIEKSSNKNGEIEKKNVKFLPIKFNTIIVKNKF